MDLEPFTFILERLGQLLVDEVKLLSTDKKKLLRSLQQQLELAQSFVRDIEEEKQRATISHVLETELEHIMLILPQIEDYLDNLQLEDAQENQKQCSFCKFKAFFSCTSNLFVHKHVVIDKALQLSKDLEDTRKSAEPYSRQSNIPQVYRRRRPPSQPNIMNEELIVGLDEDVRVLIAKLAGKDTSIMAIAGMSGSGKTTLTRKLYNHQEVKRQFRNQAWVCVSKDWDASHLVLQMCAQLHIRLAESETAAAAGFKLREFLRTNSCLVVLDDVWEIAALQELLPLLLSGGGIFLITTRNEEILHYPVLGKVYIHKARPLTPEQSWDLFSKIVRNEWHGIRSFDEECVFAEPGREMLKRCRGLPLAIVALAGLLSTRGSIQEWEAMKENVIMRIMTQNKGSLDYGPVKDMLELSYSDLPYDLKPCFLYLGIYPEDEEIYVEDLIHLWIGEGFLRTDMCFKGQTLEELGMDVVNELVQRCMVQVARRDFEEKAEKIQVHDLMRDFCIDKARETGFFNIISPSTMPSSTLDTMPLRAIIFEAKHSYLVKSPRLRSVLSIQTGKLELVSGTTKLLRVLDLQGVELNNFESHIGNLILLRHLRIWNCNGVTHLVLEQLKKLKNLLTLKLCNFVSESIMIPDDMVGSMEHLRCLILRGYEVPSVLGVGRSKGLQSLESPRGEWLCKELQAPNLIRTLRTMKLGYISLQTQLDAVSDFVGTPSNHLQILHLRVYDVLEVDTKRMKLECCLQLKSLLLGGGRIRKQEVPLLFSPNLLDLTLEWIKIEEGEDLERALAQLYQLRRLHLNQSYDGDRLTMAGLPQLQELKLIDLQNLKEWRIEQGALCQLKRLELVACPQVERIPKGISDIHTLQHLEAREMSSSFCKRLEKPPMGQLFSFFTHTGEDFHLIRHIPTIKISNPFYPRNFKGEDDTESDEEGEGSGGFSRKVKERTTLVDSLRKLKEIRMGSKFSTTQ